MPFKNAWRILVPESRKRGTALTVLLFVLFLGGIYTAFMTIDSELRAQIMPVKTVYLEDLTWTEVQLAMTNKGYDAVIIPTGGTEQNGGHVTLGKHNRVVHYTAGKIAERLGRTFVAPVIAYVPEEVHMDYAGTVSVSEETLEAVLRESAESYIRHGIKYVFFIGDSIGNQEPQRRAAAAIQSQYPDTVVVHIDDYYSNNGQIEWLKNEMGYTLAQIGGHAGIRDTSEMLVVDGKNGVRKKPVYVPERDSGHSGNFRKANRKIGEKMLELKIDAAVQQIQSITERREEVPTAEIVPH